MIKNLNLQKNEEVICSITCYPTFKSILKNTAKNLVARLVFSIIPGAVTSTRYEGKVEVILTNKNLYLQYSQDEYNSTLEFNKASRCIPINEIKNFSVSKHKENEVINISFKHHIVSLLHPNINNKNLGGKIANYIVSSV
ncbi:hypothetical protein [Clostridium tarantellae]|uniref:Uncharacterized protein n=1 Tax=Clostridium tarantellae TaxID=39493 RepID=A0A6I1MNS5_9CLOT|nr:hypothetical protein [Clostridium tarantellae]MPQ45156.1 hypothetical protein [Clostridium tarantellae]